jgi:hypothetical protein
MQYPSTELINSMVPGSKTVIHFEMDAIEPTLLGMGKRFEEIRDPVNHTSTRQMLKMARVNFDVGIWSWDRSGGTTSRMRAYQILENAFNGYKAQEALDNNVDNGKGRIEIISFTGGRFLVDTIDDVPVYRAVGGTLEVRVFIREPLPNEVGPTIEGIDQNENLTIPL